MADKPIKELDIAVGLVMRDGHLLLLQRKDEREIWDKQWEFPGGKIEKIEWHALDDVHEVLTVEVGPKRAEFRIPQVAIYGLAPTGALFLVGIPVSALLGLTYPSLQGILTSRVGPTETAFSHREAQYTLMSFVSWAPGADGTEHIKYIDSHWNNVEPFTNGFYVNDYFDHSQEQVNRTYRDNFPRLLEIKKQYDPTNLFRLNANIKAT